MTLIELILSITILAIIVIPLLHSFLTSANTSRKSEIYRNATDAAENIIEEIEATGVDQYIKSHENKNTITLDNYESGSSKFKAEIQFVAPKDTNDSKDVNSKAVAVDNPMDALIDMNDADDIALDKLYSNLEGLKLPRNPVLEDFNSRIITITAEKDSNKANTYNIEVVFNYNGNFSGENERGVIITKNDPIIVRSTSSVYSEGNISLYLFFKAYYAKVDTIIIYNPSSFKDIENAEKDFKVFLVNTKAGDPPASYTSGSRIKYYYQTDKNKTLVCSNMKGIKYSAFESGEWLLTDPFYTTGYLVEQKALDRLYSVNVKIYELGKNTPIADLSSKILN